MPTESIAEMLVLAKRLAHEAADLARSYADRITISRKADTSIVTEADRAVEAHILRAIAEVYPDHAVCAEESAAEPDPGRVKPRYCWVIDPIDGTRNYASGFPCYATSIAVLERGHPVLGVVLEHTRGDLYVATAGGGATLNEKVIRVRDVGSDDDLLIGIPSSKDKLTVTILRIWIAERGIVCRNVGSTALHLSMVGAGSLGAAYCKRCKIWDVAAGVLLVTEAGGEISDPTGGSWLPFDLTGDPHDDLPYVAGAPSTHARLLEQLRPLATE